MTRFWIIKQLSIVFSLSNSNFRLLIWVLVPVLVSSSCLQTLVYFAGRFVRLAARPVCSANGAGSVRLQFTRYKVKVTKENNTNSTFKRFEPNKTVIYVAADIATGSTSDYRLR